MNALKRLFGLRVLAILDNDEAVDGTLESANDGWLVFTRASLFQATGGDPVPMDGTQFVAHARVLRLQVP